MRSRISVEVELWRALPRRQVTATSYWGPDLDCTGGPRANPPPSYDIAQATARPVNHYPDLPAKEEVPANSATGVSTRSQVQAQRPHQQLAATPIRREPVGSRIMTEGVTISLPPQYGGREDGQFPMIEVLNP
ncbi:unnamed protein product [Arctogadus glacialis]